MATVVGKMRDSFAEIVSYKGKPMIVFRGGESDDRFPFQFQKGKAQRLLAAIEMLGPIAVIEMLKEVAE